ncbi:hypothetical protein D3C83_64660 [compost metagenome]
MYCDSISFTSVSAERISSCLAVGMCMSFTPKEMPPRVAMVKPACISLSAKITVSRRPQRRKPMLISFEISFFLSGLLRRSNVRPAGRISESSARPTVVS